MSKLSNILFERVLTTLSFCLLFFIAQSTTYAVQSSGEPSSEGSPIVVPLSYSGNHLFVVLTGDGIGKLKMLVDTGTAKTSISSARLSGFEKLPEDRNSERLEGLGDGPVPKTFGNRYVVLRQGDSPVFRGSALVLNPKILSIALGHNAEGILGWDFFMQWCVRLDSRAREMSLWPRSKCEEPKEKHGTLRGDWSSKGLLVDAVIDFANGREAKAKLKLDTGNNATLVLAPKFRKVAGISSMADPRSIGGGDGIDGHFIGDVVRIRALHLGGDRLVFKTDGSTTILVRRTYPGLRGWWREGLGRPEALGDGSFGNLFIDRLVLTFDSLRKLLYVEPGRFPNRSVVEVRRIQTH